MNNTSGFGWFFFDTDLDNKKIIKIIQAGWTHQHFCHKDERVFVELWDREGLKLLLESCWNSGLSGLVFSVKSLKKLLYLQRKSTNKQRWNIRLFFFRKMNKNTSLKEEKTQKKRSGEEVRQVASQHEIIPTRKISGHLNKHFWWRIKRHLILLNPIESKSAHGEKWGDRKRENVIGSEYISCHTLHINKWMDLTGLSSTH